MIELDEIAVYKDDTLIVGGAGAQDDDVLTPSGAAAFVIAETI